jgi:phage gp29-like protein
MATTEKKIFALTASKGEHLKRRIDTFDNFMRNYLHSLPNPSNIIQENGYNTTFSETLADHDVRSAVNTVFEGVSSLEWEIVKNGATKPEVDLAYRTIDALMKGEVVRQILYSIFYGFQALNTIWDIEGDKWYVSKIIDLPHNAIKFDNENNLRILTNNDRFRGELPEPYQILYACYDANYNNPYGNGLFLNCYKLVFIKNNAEDFWSIFTEEFGSPSIIATYDKAVVSLFKMEPEAFVEYFFNQIQKMRRGGTIVLPEGATGTPVNAATSVNPDLYDKLIKYCESGIAKLILGHNSVMSSTPGKLGNENLGESQKVDRIEAYTKFLTLYLNEILKWQHEINFSGNNHCKIRFFEKDDLSTYLQEAELATKLQGLGVKFNDSYFEEKFNLDKKYFNIEQSTTNQQIPITQDAIAKSNNFLALNIRNDKQTDNENTAMDALEKFSDMVLNSEEFNQINDDTIRTIADKIKEYDTYEEMLDNLYDIFDKLNIDNKQDFITRFMLISKIFGYNQEIENHG